MYNDLIDNEVDMGITASIFLEALLLLLGDNSERTRLLVKEFLDVYEKLSHKKEIMGSDDDLIAAYKSLIKSVLSEGTTQGDTTAAKILLLKIKTNTVIQSDPVSRDWLCDVLNADAPVSEAQVAEYTKRIRNVLLQTDMDAVARRVFSKNRSISDIKDADEQEAELNQVKQMLDDSLKAIDARLTFSDTKASESYVCLSDRESILRALDIYMYRNKTGVVVTGLQGLNKALGTRGGMGLGESYVFAAQSHNYKTGMLVSIMLWSIIYNQYKVAPGKKALVYFVSLENEVNQNLMSVFKVLYSRIENKPVNLDTLSSEVITQWIIDYFGKFDVELIIDKYAPHEFSYNKYVKRYTAFEEQGYEVVVFVLDYMSEARGVDLGDTVSSQGSMYLIKENYVKFRNHAGAAGYLSVTGHQLNRKAADVVRENRYAVKKFDTSHMADSSDVFRTIDGLIFLQLMTNMDGHKFLTAMLAKNRGCDDTPESHKFFCYPFTPAGIVDDLHGKPGFVTDIDSWGYTTAAPEGSVSEAAMF